MKRICVFLIFLLGISVLMIAYIYQNVQLIKKSYAIEEKEEEFSKVSEEYKRLMFEVNTLYSPKHLENKLTEAGLDLIHPQNVKIINRVIDAQSQLFSKKVQTSPRLSLLGTIEFMPEAHADSTDS